MNYVITKREQYFNDIRFTNYRLRMLFGDDTIPKKEVEVSRARPIQAEYKALAKELDTLRKKEFFLLEWKLEQVAWEEVIDHNMPGFMELMHSKGVRAKQLNKLTCADFELHLGEFSTSTLRVAPMDIATMSFDYPLN